MLDALRLAAASPAVPITESGLLTRLKKTDARVSWLKNGLRCAAVLLYIAG